MTLRIAWLVRIRIQLVCKYMIPIPLHVVISLMYSLSNMMPAVNSLHNHPILKCSIMIKTTNINLCCTN